MKRIAPLLAAALIGQAIAQQPPRTTVYVEENKPGSAQNGYRVDAVDTGGPLGNMKLQDAPYLIEILPAALLESVQAKSVKEALKYLPLAQFQEQQGSEVLRPATRGMQSSNFQNARLDGMTHFVTGANAIETFQQIEVFSGAASAVYGPSNPAGVFNFVTKRSTEGTLARGNFGYDSRGILTAHADLGGTMEGNDAVGYRINLLKGNGEGYVSESELDRALASLAIDIRASRDTTIELNATAYNLTQKGYPGWFTYGQAIQLPGAPDPTRVGYGQSYAGIELHNKTAHARVKHDLDPDWHLVAGILAQRIDRNINTPVNNLVNNAGDYVSSLANGFAPRFGILSDIAFLNGTFRTGSITHDLTLGTTGFRADTYAVLVPATPASVLLGTANIDSPRIFPQPAIGMPNTGNQFKSSVASQQGINVSDTIGFSKEWSVRLAVSQDWIQTRNYNTTGAQTTSYADSGASPMPSVIYKPRDNVTTYLTYASSLQQGDLAPAGSVNANTGLAPYRSKQLEAGLKVALPKLDFAVALFRLERPFANVDTADNVFKIMGQQVNKGLEMMAVGEIANHLRLYGGVTFLDPTLEGTGVPATDGKQYVGMPKFKSNMLFEYDVPSLAGLTVVFDWQYSAKRPGNDTNTTFAPSYNTFDLGARYAAQLGGRRAVWRLAVNNLADERYWSTVAPSNITGTNRGNMVAHIGAPRTVTASLSVDF